MENEIWLQREVRALYTITEAINQTLSLTELLAIMLERTVSELHYKAATLRLLDEEHQTLELKAAYGLSEAYLAKGAVAVAKSGIDQTVLTNQAVEVGDVRSDPGFQYAEAAAREGLAGVLALPLAVRGRVIGVLRLYTATPHTFSDAERAFLGVVANLGAQAIQRTRLYEAFQAIAANLNASLSIKQVLTTLLLESVNELNVKAGSIRLLGPRRATLHLAAAYGLSANYLAKGTVEVAQSPIDQRVLHEVQPLAITELTAEAGLQYPVEAQREGIRSLIVVPLSAHGATIGVLRLYSSQVRRFSAEELAFASAVANLGALAIENARIHAMLQDRMDALKEDSNGWFRFLALS
ncbi:MAG TPA: GAF domain-containing protein [Roseiflexaceae bacterium]|nr:GAF domain-containing protein [Roseiflexaceae bacterium]